MNTRNLIIFVILLLCCSKVIGAEADSTISVMSNKIGYYAAVEIQIAEINGEFGKYTGIRGGLIINDRLILGLIYRILTVSDLFLYKDFNWTTTSHKQAVETSFFGIQPGLSLEIRSTLNLNCGIIVGFGSASAYTLNNQVPSFEQFKLLGTANYIVIEPFLGIEFKPNVKWLRFELISSYKFVDKIKLPNSKDNFIDGFGISVNFKFGIF